MRDFETSGGGNMFVGKQHILPAIILILSTFVSGCAVLTIDVDVYKGPLMNQDEVQLEETAALAIATRPLLEILSTEILTAPDKDRVQLLLADQLLKILCLYGKERVGNCERIPYYGEVSLEEAFEQYIGYRQDPMSPQSEDNKNQMLNRLTRFADRKSTRLNSSHG